MTGWFADTFFFLALLAEDDESHGRAVEIVAELETDLVTTAWVLTEVADGLAARGWRARFVELLDLLRRHPRVTIIPPDEARFDRGLELYARRPDKLWTLTDCISFTVMEELGITDALTGDHHFEQAGFVALLK
jgi:predicted nucleic acid-binding protein